MQNFFRCEEGNEDKCRKILIKKVVRSVTDMLYEARISAVVRIEASKGLRCERAKAIYLYPKAHEYISVNLLVLVITCMSNT